MPKVIGQDTAMLKRATCRHCGAINEYWPYEVVTLYSGRDYDGSQSVTKGFKCGGCNSEVITESY